MKVELSNSRYGVPARTTTFLKWLRSIFSELVESNSEASHEFNVDVMLESTMVMEPIGIEPKILVLVLNVPTTLSSVKSLIIAEWNSSPVM